jgi:hypothetical protein
MNPNGQHLDFRQLPSLTVLLVVIPILSAFLCLWLVDVFLKRRKFSAIHAYLAVINFFLCFIPRIPQNIARHGATDGRRDRVAVPADRL